jgi:phosphatidylserine decarboxylase
LNDIQIPLFLRAPYFNFYSYLTGVDKDEMKLSIKEFSSMNEFFTRELKDGIRPIAKGIDLVAPSDGLVLGFGKFPIPVNASSSFSSKYHSDFFLKFPNFIIEHVKGFRFPLWQFLGESCPVVDSSQAHHQLSTSVTTLPPSHSLLATDGPTQSESSAYSLPKSSGTWFNLFMSSKPSENSLYYMSIYLAPGDYHRFHSPCDFTITSIRHIFGESFPVAPRILSWINDAYILNERTPCLGNWKYGKFSMTPVGSTNVNSIFIHSADKLSQNFSSLVKSSAPSMYSVMPWTATISTRDDLHSAIPNRASLTAGQELGYFKMGSTIVLIFEAPDNFQFLVKDGDAIKMGSPLGHCS